MLAARADDTVVVAACAMAIATVSSHVDPDSDRMARLWLDGMRRDVHSNYRIAMVPTGAPAGVRA